MYRWEDGIKIDLREIRCGLVSAGSGQGPVVGSFEHSTEHPGSMSGREFID
jgi:hypothetical protein